MSKIILIIISVFTVVISSCTVKGKQGAVFSQIDTLQGVVLKSNRVPMGAFSFSLIDDLILFKLIMHPKQYSLYQSEGDSLIWMCDFLNIGRGHRESLSSAVDYNSATGDVMVYCGNSNFVGVDNIYKTNVHDINSPWSYSDLARDITPNQIKYLTHTESSNKYIVSGFDDLDTFFSLLDIDANNITPLSLVFPNDDVDASLSVKKMAYLSEIKKHPLQDRFVSSSDIGRYVQLFDFSGGDIINLQLLFDDFPRYESMIVGGLEQLRHLEGCYAGMDVSVNQDHIYLLDRELYSGNFSGRSVYVFDWAGIPVRKIILPFDTKFIEVDQQDKYIYVIGANAQTQDEEITKIAL